MGHILFYFFIAQSQVLGENTLKYLIEIPAMAMVTLGQLNLCDRQSSNYFSVTSNCLGNWTITQIRESENGVKSVDQRFNLISMFLSLLVFFKSPGAAFTKLMASCYVFLQTFIYESDVQILFRNVNCHFSIQFLLCCCYHIY
jgi:hypothetical protein